MVNGVESQKLYLNQKVILVRVENIKFVCKAGKTFSLKFRIAGPRAELGGHQLMVLEVEVKTILIQIVLVKLKGIVIVIDRVRVEQIFLLHLLVEKKEEGIIVV